MSVKHISLLELHKIHLFEQENNNDRLIVIGSKGIQLHLASSMHPCTYYWYQEPEICSKRVPLPSAANGTVGRTLHYQTACLDGRANRCDFTLWDGKAPNMKPGCGPIPLLGGPKSIRITLASTHSSPPAEARDLMRRMVKDIREPCSHRPSCTTPGTPKGLSYHIIDRDEQDRPIRIFNSGWIWLDDADRKIVIDLYK